MINILFKQAIAKDTFALKKVVGNGFSAIWGGKFKKTQN